MRSPSGWPILSCVAAWERPRPMALEACRPLNFLGSQALTFLAPFATLVFSRDEYQRFTRMLERRQSIDLLAEAIAQRESQKNG